jgi:quinol monooxygenase YgiN
MNENDHKITVHVRLKAKPGKIEDLLNELEKFTEETRSETGCEYSEILQNFEDLHRITIVEKFTNYQAFKAHMQMPRLRNFIDNLSSKLLDENHVSFHLTRIDCNGDRDKETEIEKISFREDLLDRK